MTPEQAAAASRQPVLELGGAFTECPQTLRRARLLGLTGWQFQITGRAGALGDVGVETATAVLGFIAPEAVADGWHPSHRDLRPEEVAMASYLECCRWGNERLGELAQVGRLAELTGRLVRAADATGMPLFAAWRARPIPDETPAALLAAHLHLLREYFVEAYLLAVRVSGITPLGALLAGRDGEADAVAAGWPPPYPPAGPLVRQRLWAEAATDRLAGSAFRGLAVAERREVTTLLAAAHESLRAGLHR